jgi:hypothetical protein
MESTVISELSSIALPIKHEMSTNPDLFKEKMKNNREKIVNCIKLMNNIINKTERDIHVVQMALINEINN